MKKKSKIVSIIIFFFLCIFLVGKAEAQEDSIIKFIPAIDEINITIHDSMLVYEGYTLDELTIQLNKSLNSTIAGKGNIIASRSIEKGVNPFLATAIMLQETGCAWECSYLVKTCNNVGGQKGYGCGTYSAFPSLDEGIIAFIDNIANNYASKGLKTAEQMNSAYAEDKLWAVRVNRYIEKIKAA